MMKSLPSMGEDLLSARAYGGVSQIEQERATLFGPGAIAPLYAGNALWLPEVGRVEPLPWDRSWALSRSTQGIHLLSNVCTHRGAILCEEPQSAAALVCPQHRASFALDGKFLGLGAQGLIACQDLPTQALSAQAGGMLMQGAPGPLWLQEQLDALGCGDMNLTGMALHSRKSYRLAADWKIFMEIYLDLLHIEAIHPGLRSQVSAEACQWGRIPSGCAHEVPMAASLGVEEYRPWREALRAAGLPEPERVRWVCLWPNLMIESYGPCLVLSSVWPDGVGGCVNHVEFYGPEELVAFEPKALDAFQAAYLATAQEDERFAASLSEGRRALANRGEAGPRCALHPLEQGIGWFHEWLRESGALAPGSTR